MEAIARVSFVGRQPELRELSAEMRRAAAGELRCALLLADAGVGKTRLGLELLSRQRRLALGLRARAYPFGGTASFGMWVEALESHLRTLDPNEVRALCGGFVDDLAVLFRSVAAAPGATPAARPSRLRLLGGLTVLLENLARRRPVIIVLDDVHLADASSWEALNYVARNLRNAPLLLLLLGRPGELAGQHIPTEIVLALEQEGMLRRLTLQPLTHQLLRELARKELRTTPPEELVVWLYEHSRGVPLFAIGLLRALVEERADLRAPALQRLPEDLADRIGVRVQNLSDAERSALETMAVLGRRTDVSDLSALQGRPLEQLVIVLNRLVQLRLLAADENPRNAAYEVAHPLMQEAIYSALGPARRRALHRLVARVLLQSGKIADASVHFARSAKPGDPEVIDALINAVHHAESRGLYREALPTLEALLQLLPPGDPDWLRVADVMTGEAEWVTDHMGDAFAPTGVRAMREIEKVVRISSDLRLKGLVQLRLASFLAWGTGDLDDARCSVERAISLFDEAGDQRLALLARNECAWITGLQGDLQTQATAATAVVKSALARDESLIAMQALSNVGRATLLSGHFDVAEDALKRGIAIAQDQGKTYRLSWNLSALSWSYALGGRMREALELLKECRRVNPDYRESLVLEIGAHVQWMAGDFPACVSVALESAAWHADHPSRRRAAAMAMAAMSAAEMGQLDKARAYLGIAQRVFGDVEWYWASHFCTWAEGVIDVRHGALWPALSALRRASQRLLDMGAITYAAFVLLDLAEAATAARDKDTAESAASQLQDAATTLSCVPYTAMAPLAASYVQLHHGSRDAALANAAEAVRVLDAGDYAALRGRALHALGSALCDGDRAGAAAVLGRAAPTFAACSATSRRDECLELLAGLGHAGRRAAAASLGPESLTRREKEVAHLAAQGLSAKAIGDRLFIGERTVETHLESVYAKLGVGSKIDLVRRAGAFGL